MMLDRGRFLSAAGAGIAAGLLPRPAAAQTVNFPFENGSRPVLAFPQKRPLIVLTPRPPQLETPIAIFDDGVFTPNDAFFVRWHLPEVQARSRRVGAAPHTGGTCQAETWSS